LAPPALSTTLAANEMPPSHDPVRPVTTWLRDRGVRFERVWPLAGDVSERRYARVDLGAGETAVIAWYPAHLVAAGERFCRTAALLAEAGVRVPSIRQWDPEAGLMWLEDVGDRSLYDAALAGDAIAGPRRRSVAVAARIAALPAPAVAAVNPPLDGAVLRRELDQSWRLVLEPRSLTGEGDLSEDFRRALSALCERLAGARTVPCHRDFMARNLILGEAEEPIVIDHQDLRLGPPWYDLASLLNDSVYASEPEEDELLDLARVPRPEREAYHRAAAQRALKIVGTFAAFAERGVTRHLALVPPSLRAAHRHLSRLPETAGVLRRLTAAWEPALC
jgi:N-acetylmuramate 1-kinase